MSVPVPEGLEDEVPGQKAAAVDVETDAGGIKGGCGVKGCAIIDGGQNRCAAGRNRGPESDQLVEVVRRAAISIEKVCLCPKASAHMTGNLRTTTRNVV